MRDLQTEIECINLRIEILNEESIHLYKLLGNFQLINNQSLDEVRQVVLARVQKRKEEMKKEIDDLFLRVKQLGKHPNLPI